MARPKSAPAPVFAKAPPAARTIVVADLVPFCAAVYELGLEPDTAWRALSYEHARDMQTVWASEGIASSIVPLPEPLAIGGEDDIDDAEAA